MKIKHIQYFRDSEKHPIPDNAREASDSDTSYNETSVLILTLILLTVIAVILTAFYKNRNTQQPVINDRDFSCEPMIQVVASPSHFFTNIR